VATSTDAAGDVTTYSYNSKGELTGVSGPLGSGTTDTYSASGNLLTSTPTGGYTTSYTYDANGNVNGTSYAYNSATISTATVYDDQGRVTSQTDAHGIVTTTDYNNFLNKVADTVEHVAYATGGTLTTTYKYDINGNLLETDNPDGTVTQNVYDQMGQLILSTAAFVPGQAAPIRGTLSTYDGDGRVVSTSKIAGVSITLTQEDATNHLYAVTGVSTGGVTSGTGASLLQVSGTTGIGTAWMPNPNFVAWLNQTVTVYNSDGTVQSTTESFNTATGSQDIPSETTSYVYDLADRQTEEIEPQVTVWNAVNSSLVTTTPIMHTTYDVDGRQSVVTDAQGYKTTYKYDSLGNLVATIFDDGSQISDTYDALGEKTSETDQNGNTTHYNYSNGHLVAVIQPAVANALDSNNSDVPITKYVYDAFGNETSQQDADGNTTQFSYDAFGDQTGETLPMSQSESSFYNSYGQLDHSFDFKGNETKYAYDALGRVSTISYYPSSNLSTADDVVTYAYTPLGQVSTLTETFASGPTRTDTYTYDADGNVISDQSVQGTINQTVYHTYDPATGQLMQTHTADGAASEAYTYDALGRLATVTAGSQVTSYTYDLDGNLHSTTTVNGSTTTVATNTYDDLNRLIGLTNVVNGTTINQYTYTLDQGGNRIQAAENINGSTQTINYTYDALNRLTEESYPTGLSITYAYDLDGNRITETETGGSANGTTTSTYNANNELVNAEAPSGSYTFYYYDANGSLTSTATASSLGGTQTTTATYTFSDRNRLVSDNVNGTTDSYSYDDDGDRVSKTTNGTVTNYEIDTASPTGYDQVLEETSSSHAVQVVYVWGQQLVSETQSSATSLYLFDGHGSVTRLASVSSGAITDTYYYDAFGNLLSSSGSTNNVYRFAAMRLDGGTGMYDDAARYYTPPTGEFISRDEGREDNKDPITGMKYLYAESNPVMFNDPSGYVSMWLGTAVNNYLSAQFEQTGAVNGSRRFGNRWVSTILSRLGYAGATNRIRPDAVEVYGTGSGIEGDVYEFKAADFSILQNPQNFIAKGNSVLNDEINNYYIPPLAAGAPSIQWQAGSLLWPTIRIWPNFTAPGMPADTQLVTFDSYNLVPGVIFYDFVKPPQGPGKDLWDYIKNLNGIDATSLIYLSVFAIEALWKASSSLLAAPKQGALALDAEVSAEETLDALEV
jgi:RHS repeat-associated protein